MGRAEHELFLLFKEKTLRGTRLEKEEEEEGEEGRDTYVLLIHPNANRVATVSYPDDKGCVMGLPLLEVLSRL